MIRRESSVEPSSTTTTSMAACVWARALSIACATNRPWSWLVMTMLAAVTATTLSSLAAEATARPRGPLNPILRLEPDNTREVSGIVRDERQPQRQSMSRDEGVECADGLAAPSQGGRDRAEASRRGLIEREHPHGLHERADQAVKLSGSPGFGTEAQLRECDRADAELRGPMFEQTCRDPPLPSEGKAHRVRVEHVLWHQANGSRSSRTARCLGRGMSLDQAPRQARNASGHSSTTSRMTRRPSRRTRTSR